MPTFYKVLSILPECSINFLEEEIGIRAHWWHILFIVIPDNLNPAYASNGTIWVTGDDNEENNGTGVTDPDDSDLRLITTLATGIGMPFAALYQVS